MFGKPEWFREVLSGKALLPVTREGWYFAAGAGALVFLPAAVLWLMPHRGTPEALIWMLAAMAGVIWEGRSILRAMHPAPVECKDVLYIGDDEADSVRTGKLDLKLRR